MKYLLGICIGTSNTKAILTNVEGKIISSSVVDYKFERPFPGWTEQNPDLWFKSTVSVIKDILEKSDICPKDILSLGLSGQMHSTVFLGNDNRVIRPAPLWNDQRTKKECEFLLKYIGLEKILKLTSNKPLTSFSLPKLLWLRNNEHSNYKNLKKICLSKDFVKLKLSGKLSTDPSDASGTLCFDVKNHKWSDELFNELKLNIDILPDVIPSGKFSANISKDGSEITGLPEGLPILTGTGDTAGEMLGNGICKEGDCQIILGTGGVVLIYHSDYYPKSGKLDEFCFPDGKFYSLGVTLSSSASLTWGLNNIGLNLDLVMHKLDKNINYYELSRVMEKNKYHILTDQTKRVNPGSDGLIFLPYLAGERAPYSDPSAKGVFFGLNFSHNRGHMLRSIMEGVAFSHKDCFQIVEKRGFNIKNIIISGGGAKDDLWCQVYADIFNSQITRMSFESGPSFGMCLLNAVSLKLFNSISDASKKFLRTEKVFHPNTQNTSLYKDLYDIYHNLYPKLKDSFDKINSFQENNYNL